MKVVYTNQSISSLEDCLDFAMTEGGLTYEKATILKLRLLDRADSLALNPYKGQREEYLQHLEQDHRRIVENHIKIIYKVIGETVFITDFFDSRQDPDKMKG